MTTAWRLVRNRAGLTWLLLIAATMGSFTLGLEASTQTWAGCLILLIALIKVRLIGLDFMELRAAPVALRAAFEAYCAVLLVMLVALYLGQT